MKRQITMIAFILLGMGMTASAQFGKKFNLGSRVWKNVCAPASSGA